MGNCCEAKEDLRPTHVQAQNKLQRRDENEEGPVKIEYFGGSYGRVDPVR